MTCIGGSVIPQQPVKAGYDVFKKRTYSVTGLTLTPGRQFLGVDDLGGILLPCEDFHTSAYH